MNLYLIWQEENNNYDTYDSCVVCAENIDEASKIHPNGHLNGWETRGEWASSPDKVFVKLIGKAESYISKGVILASFMVG